MNDLRSRIVVEVDGQLKTGRDVVDRRAAGRGGVRVRDGTARRPRLHRDAGLPPQHLPGGRRHAGPRAAQALRGRPAARRELHDASSPRRSASTWRGWASGRWTRWSAGPTGSRSGPPSTTGRRAASTSRGSSPCPTSPAPTRARQTKLQDHGVEASLDATTLLDLAAPALTEGLPGPRRPADPQRQPDRRDDARLRGHPPLGPRRPPGRHDPPRASRAPPARASGRSCRPG